MKIPLWIKARKKILNTFYRNVSPVVVRRSFDVDLLASEITNENTQDILKFSPLVISFDDISAMRKTTSTFDFGGSEGSSALALFESFTNASTQHKSTLFYVPAPSYLWNPEYGIDGTGSLFLPESAPSLIELLKTWEKANLVEIALHGLHHYQNRKPAYFSSFEFEWLTNEEIHRKLTSGFEIMTPYFKIHGFKPPAWSVGQLDGSYKIPEVLKSLDQSFEYVCLSSPSNGLNYETKRVSHIYPQGYQGLLNIPQNISILWDLQKTKDIISLIVEKKGVVNIQLHFSESRSGLDDGLSTRNLDKLHELVLHSISAGAKSTLCKEIPNLIREHS